MQGKRSAYHYWHIVFFLPFFMGVQLHAAILDGGGEEEEKRDTVRAVVFYGDNDPLTKQGAIGTAELDGLLDSLYLIEPLPEELIEEIEAYRFLRSKSEKELATMIDSLFELESIPYAYINQINLYIATLHERPGPVSASLLAENNDHTWPANSFYGGWNTTKPDPYGAELSANDTTVMLLIQDTLQNCGYHPPFKGLMTSRFGWRDGRNHNGVDIDLEVWDPVHSAFSGVVRFASSYGGWGRLVVVRHYNGLETFYAHLHRFKVKVGDVVEAGDVVGLGGSSGHSTGSHLHFEVRFKGIPLNPMNIISFKEDRPLSDTLVLKKTRWSYAAIPLGTVFHNVESGDFLYRIAEQYGTSVNEICDLNGIRRNSVLRVGQRLRVSRE